MDAALKIALGGKAQVCCVHDRQKREVVSESHVALLGLQQGVIYDPKQHRIHRCACCENLFVDPSDEPRFCSPCRRPLAHELGGPLPHPIGEVSG